MASVCKESIEVSNLEVKKWGSEAKNTELIAFMMSEYLSRGQPSSDGAGGE